MRLETLNITCGKELRMVIGLDLIKLSNDRVFAITGLASRTFTLFMILRRIK